MVFISVSPIGRDCVRKRSRRRRQWPVARTLSARALFALLCRARDGLKMLVLHGRHQAILPDCARADPSERHLGWIKKGRAVHNAAGDDQVVVAQGWHPWR